MKTTFKHEVELEYEDYPKLWDHEDYLKFLADNHPSIKEVVKEDYSDTGSALKYSNYVKPHLPIPGNLKNVISSSKLEYSEVVEWNTNENNHKFEAVMHKASFIKAKGTFKLEKISDRKYMRITTIEIKVGIPLVGGLVEKFLAKQLDENYKIEGQLRGKYGVEKLYK